MKKTTFLLPAAGAIGILLAACISSPGEDTGTGTANLCTASERLFNGSCHDVCTSSSDCTTAGDSCMTVSEGVALCLDYSQCGYFGSDTTCAGVPSANGEGPYGTEDPYWTPDPYDSDPYYVGETGYGGITPYGCSGDGPFKVAAPVAGDDPKCGETHNVTRCEKIGNRCALVSGTTIDVAEK